MEGKDPYQREINDRQTTQHAQGEHPSNVASESSESEAQVTS